MSETKFYHVSTSGIFSAYQDIDKAIAELSGGGFIWLDYFQPLKEDLCLLIDKIGIHPLSVEDCLDEKQVPKIDYFPNNTFIIFNAFNYEEKTLFIDEINLFVGKNFLISVSGNNSGTRKPLNNISEIVNNGHSNSMNGPDFMMHIILDYLVDFKYKAFDDMEEELEQAEESLLDDVEKFQPMELIRMRKNLMLLRKSLFHEREILVKICRQDSPFVSEKAIIHYRDIYDHLAKFFELTETYREIETSLMELYTSLLNNLMTKMSNETNLSVRRLTLIATVFMPLTLIASIGGMSEWSMMTGPSNWKLTYPIFIAGMVVIGIINLFLIRRIEKKQSSGL
jgi:magnesium transporter